MTKEVIVGPQDERSPQLPSERVMQKLEAVLEGRMTFDRQDVRLADVIHGLSGRVWLDALGVPPIHIVVVRPGNNDHPLHCAKSGYNQRDSSAFSSYFSTGGHQVEIVEIGSLKKDKDILSFSNINLIQGKIYDLEFEVTRNPKGNEYTAVLNQSSKDSRYFTSKEPDQAVLSWPVEPSEEPKPQVIVIAINPDDVEDEFVGRGLRYGGSFVTSFEDTERSIVQAFYENGLLKSTQDETIEQVEQEVIIRLRMKEMVKIQRIKHAKEEIVRTMKENPSLYYASLTAELDRKGIVPMTPYRAKYTFIDSRGYLIKKDVAVSRSRNGVVRAVFDHVRISQLEEEAQARSTPMSGEEVDKYFDNRVDAGRIVIEISEDATTVTLERRKSGGINYSEDSKLDPGVAAHFIPKLEEFTSLARPKNPGKPPSRGSADSSMVYQRGGNGSLADFEEAEQRRREARKLDFQNAVKAAERSLNSAKEMD